MAGQTYNALFVTLASDANATAFMAGQGWQVLPKIPQVPAYLFWYGFNAVDTAIGTTQNSPYVFASLLLP